MKKRMNFKKVRRSGSELHLDGKITLKLLGLSLSGVYNTQLYNTCIFYQTTPASVPFVVLSASGLETSTQGTHREEGYCSSDI